MKFEKCLLLRLPFCCWNFERWPPSSLSETLTDRSHWDHLFHHLGQTFDEASERVLNTPPKVAMTDHPVTLTVWRVKTRETEQNRKSRDSRGRLEDKASTGRN